MQVGDWGGWPRVGSGLGGRLFEGGVGWLWMNNQDAEVGADGAAGGSRARASLGHPANPPSSPLSLPQELSKRYGEDNVRIVAKHPASAPGLPRPGGRPASTTQAEAQQPSDSAAPKQRPPSKRVGPKQQQPSDKADPRQRPPSDRAAPRQRRPSDNGGPKQQQPSGKAEPKQQQPSDKGGPKQQQQQRKKAAQQQQQAPARQQPQPAE